MFFTKKRKLKILLVDDDVDMLNYMVSALKELDYDVLTATSALDGLKLLKDEGNFDLLITDIMMPMMNGVVFLEHVKVFYPDLRISVCSSGGSARSGEYTADELLELALVRGALFALRKPFSRGEFRELIESMLNYQNMDEEVIS